MWKVMADGDTPPRRPRHRNFPLPKIEIGLNILYTEVTHPASSLHALVLVTSSRKSITPEEPTCTISWPLYWPVAPASVSHPSLKPLQNPPCHSAAPIGSSILLFPTASIPESAVFSSLRNTRRWS